MNLVLDEHSDENLTGFDLRSDMVLIANQTLAFL